MVLDVPEATLEQLVAIFSDLRELADNSLLSYPYSTRELVNIVKHLQIFPKDPITQIVRNVFDFDNYDKDVMDSVQEVRPNEKRFLISPCSV